MALSRKSLSRRSNITSHVVAGKNVAGEAKDNMQEVAFLASLIGTMVAKE